VQREHIHRETQKYQGPKARTNNVTNKINNERIQTEDRTGEEIPRSNNAYRKKQRRGK